MTLMTRERKETSKLLIKEKITMQMREERSRNVSTLAKHSSERMPNWLNITRKLEMNPGMNDGKLSKISMGLVFYQSIEQSRNIEKRRLKIIGPVSGSQWQQLLESQIL